MRKTLEKKDLEYEFFIFFPPLRCKFKSTNGSYFLSLVQKSHLEEHLEWMEFKMY